MTDPVDHAAGMRVSYEYIKEHERIWVDDAAPLLERIMTLARDMNIQCRSSLFFKDFLNVHERMANFVRDRSDEGHQAHFDIARTLGEIRAFYELRERDIATDLRRPGRRTP